MKEMGDKYRFEIIDLRVKIEDLRVKIEDLRFVIIDLRVSKWTKLFNSNFLINLFFGIHYINSVFESRTPNSELRITKWTKSSLNKSTFDIQYSLFVILSNLNSKFGTLKWIKLMRLNSLKTSLFDIPFLNSIFECRTPNSELRITKWTKSSLNKSTFDIRFNTIFLTGLIYSSICNLKIINSIYYEKI